MYIDFLNILIVKAQYELDLRKLSNELKMLEERNAILEKERSHEVEATKTNFSSNFIFYYFYSLK